MGKQALSSHVKGKKHKGLEAARKMTVLILMLIAAESFSPSATVSEVAPLPITTVPRDQLVVNSINERVIPDSTVDFQSVTTQAETVSCSCVISQQLLPTTNPKQLYQAPATACSAPLPTMLAYIQKDAEMKAEIHLCMLAAMRDISSRDISSLVDLLPDMFSDSDIASKVQLQKTKVNYGVVFGLGPYIAQQLLDTVAACEMVAQDFDESLNKVSQNQQIILSAWREPLAGWVDNWNGPTGMIAAAGRGFFRTMLCHEDMVADLVPVDVVINLLICTAWRTAIDHTPGIKVYNCTSGSQNPITWKEFVDGCFVYLHKHPMGGMLWYPSGRCRSSPLMDAVCRVAFHTAPAYLIDAVRWLTGRRTMMVRIQGRLQKAVQCLRYFSTHQWHFRNDNVRLLSLQLSEADRATFPFDISMLDWSSYLEDYILGIRHFVFKDKPESLPETRRLLRR
ncbi:hypothetical protein J437_LFUL013657 [Ladona fulva]|uniref:Fatty acyl-CoA reductase n=1 Tax=Ladona fulva TaxID=123851 RepID=A0A8K0KIM8_LADFU|nr:hypothetical protein J437_LFUL013657 [Ladona fulva]